MCFMQGRKRTGSRRGRPGDIVALLKLKDTRTNDILSDEKAEPMILPIEFPHPVYERTIVTPAKGDEEKASAALAALALENPSIRHYFNPETREEVLSGMGALQLDILAGKIRSRYGVSVSMKPPRIPYKETVRGRAEVQGKYKRQSGGRGQYGDCWLKIEPVSRGTGF